jgi:type III pantothenate kinase
MNLALDIGNTSIKFGVFENHQLIQSGYFDHGHQDTVIFYKEKINQILETVSIQSILIASVVPLITDIMTSFLQLEFSGTVHVLSKDDFLVMPIDIDNPNELGIDLIADAFGAKAEYGENVIIADLGTATKVMAIVNGTFIGVSIAPGITSSLKGLIANASLLKQIQVDVPNRLFGKNTQESLLSGTIYGHAALVEGLIQKGLEILNLPGDVPIIITGGYAPLVTPYVKTAMIYDKLLSLKGIIRSKNDEKTNNT